MRSDIALVMREVDASIWCDRVRWRGSELTLSSFIRDFDMGDLCGSRIVKKWKEDLDAVTIWGRPVEFRIRSYGCSRIEGSVVCHATFEVR